MSSLMTSRGQVDSDIRFLKALSATYFYTPTGTITSNMSSASFLAATTLSVIPQSSGTIFRDMGKRTITFNSNNQEVAKYVLVQPQKGPTSEGVPANYATEKFYVQVWASAADPLAVTVGRLG